MSWFLFVVFAAEVGMVAMPPLAFRTEKLCEEAAIRLKADAAKVSQRVVVVTSCVPR